MSTIEPSDVGPAVGGDLRVSDKDRDQVIDLLGTAYAEGRLTHEEHTQRVEEATRARVFDDLIPLTRDLVPLDAPLPMNQPRTVPTQQPGARQLPVVDPHRANPASDNLIAIFGGNSRSGNWRVRSKINSFDMFGGNDLDLTEAVFESNEVVIEGAWIFGGDDIMVPAGVNVRNEVVGVFGGTDLKGIVGDPNGPTIVLKGLALFGGVSVHGPDSGKGRRLARQKARRQGA